MANNKVYYGEYSLKRWIDLILSGNIILPPYQRYFVWKENQVTRLLKSIKNGFFLPAVTIGSSIDAGGKKVNLVLDGQQRLTSLLLWYLGKFPKRQTPSVKKYADENDAEEIDADDSLWSEWTLKEIQRLGKNKQDILDEINTNYNNKYFDYSIPNFRLDPSKYFIQFAYIVPDSTASEKERSRYLTNVFHSINKEGTKLTPIESRTALYYQGEDNRHLFEPTCFKDIKVNNSPVDYVRFIALLSNYKKVGKDKMALGYSAVHLRESLYEDFVYTFVDDGFSDSDVFSFDKSVYEARLTLLDAAFNDLSLKVRPCNNIIELDYVYAGLIYHIVIEGKSYTKQIYDDTVKQAIIDAYMNASPEERRRPGQLSWLRNRIDNSISIYSQMFV